MREKRNALLCGSLFLSLCQREIAALRALELHRITQNINMQIAFFREGNFISAGKCFLHCTQAQQQCCLGASGGYSGNTELGRVLNSVRILLPPLLGITHGTHWSVTAGYRGHMECRGQVTCSRSNSVNGRRRGRAQVACPVSQLTR